MTERQTSTSPGRAGQWRVAVGAREASAILDPASVSPASGLYVCAPGAGGHMSDRGMLAVSRTLTAHGLDVLRFNFLYKEQGGRRPDPMPLLQECMAAVAAAGVEKLRPRRTILGGRSMGGRVATVLAARGYPCDGLLLLAYPLHPAGQPDRLRSAHLADIEVPVLCFNGTRDSLCRRDLMETAIRGLERWTMHWLESADHGFHVTKSSGRADEDIIEEVGLATAAWLSRLPARSG